MGMNQLSSYHNCVILRKSVVPISSLQVSSVIQGQHGMSDNRPQGKIAVLCIAANQTESGNYGDHCMEQNKDKRGISI